MISRRVVARLFAAAMLAAPAARAEPLTADQLPPSLLADCDARAAAFGAYDAPIAKSVAALVAMGVFSTEEFAGVRIGFCPLRAAGGPVAAASCAEDVILLDEKYSAKKETLVLNATLAHEMHHRFQHQAGRRRHGAGFCDGADYAAGKAQMETEADAFGDAVGELFFLGRPVEIVNDCNAPVAVYLEADEPAAEREGEIAFETVAARSRGVLRERAYSSRFFYYAETRGEGGVKEVFKSPASPQRRFIGGRQIRLREARLEAAGRSAGPFRLRLSCAAARD